VFSEHYLAAKRQRAPDPENPPHRYLAQLRERVSQS